MQGVTAARRAHFATSTDRRGTTNVGVRGLLATDGPGKSPLDQRNRLSGGDASPMNPTQSAGTNRHDARRTLRAVALELSWPGLAIGWFWPSEIDRFKMQDNGWRYLNINHAPANLLEALGLGSEGR